MKQQSDKVYTFSCHTDLAVELKEEMEKRQELTGVDVLTRSYRYHGIEETHIEIKNEEGANLIGKPADVLKAQNEKASYASYAVRFAASLDNVMVVLSGMSNEEQLEDNTSYMEQFKPLNDTEQQAIREVVEELRKLPTIACTKCRYCVDGCPQKILIPDQFEAYNLMIQFGDTPAMRQSYKWAVGEPEHGKASACIRCGKCEKQCPQHLPIRELLAKMAEVYEK